MRSDLVALASRPVSNRFLLVRATSQLARKFHRPFKERVADTINVFLHGLGDGKYFVSKDGAICGAIPSHAQKAADVVTPRPKPGTLAKMLEMEGIYLSSLTPRVIPAEYQRGEQEEVEECAR